MKKNIKVYIVCVDDDYGCGVDTVYTDPGEALDALRGLFLNSSDYTCWCEDNGLDENLNSSVDAYTDSSAYGSSMDRYWISEREIEVDV